MAHADDRSTPATAPDSVFATYRVETAYPLETAAAALAGEQSAGTFVRVAGETPELLAQYGAKVVRIDRVDPAPTSPSLPGAERSARAAIQAAIVKIEFPLGNIGLSLPNLFTMVAGNLFELEAFSGVRLLDIELPERFTAAQPGPQHGITGTRRLSGVHGRPLIGTIVKPSVGLSPADTAARVDALAEAGIDFIKDDELIASPPYSPLPERIRAVMPVIHRHADRTGRKVMYAFNITGTTDEMLRHHDLVRDAGGTCVMVNLIPTGLTGILHLRARCELAIHGHRSGWGMFSRCPALGMDYLAAEKMWRLAGVDHLHVNGLRNKFCETDESVLASARSVQTPLHGRHAAMPVFSSGQTVWQVPDTLRALGNVDILYLAGGGISGHPMGPAAGLLSLRQAWEAALAGTDLTVAAQSHPELRAALDFFPAMSTTSERPLLGFYGDDFTGSTDVLEALSVSGVPAVLFLTPQDATRHAGEFGAARALGIAGISRSLPTARMDEELDPAFTALGRLRPQHVLYKLCSTFDSSPELGSNGHALETLLRHFPASWIPLVVGAPALRRYLVFGNLFAGFRTTTTRLDRHPTMSRHPVTPMGEADLRLHLARQTTLPLGLVDCLALSAGTAVARRALDDIRAATPGGIVFFDTLTNEHLDVIGELLSSAEGADRDTPIAPIAGSSAIVYALARAWARAGLIEVARALPAPTPIERLLVVSGSAAPQTAAQLAAAEAAGWAMFRIDVPALAGTQGAAEFARLVDAAAGALAAGRSTVLFSARGPDDPALTAGIGASATLGAAQGRLVREILLRSGIRRACVAGGDTSGHAARQLGIYALEFVGSVAPGAPLCRARSSDPAFNGVELALKGGQCGDDRYFLKLGR